MINTENAANIWAPIDPTYIKAQDSWWYAGAAPFSSPVPPYNGVPLNSGNVGSNLFQGAYGTAFNTPVAGSTTILNLVLNMVGTEAHGLISGVVGRGGVDYAINVPLFYEGVGGPPLTSLGVSPGALAFGYVRLGTTAQSEVTATNTGTGGLLSGTFGAVTGEFSPTGAQSFGPLAAGAHATQLYTYTPTSRGLAVSSASITSDAGAGSPNASVPLTGTGVGPSLSSSQLPGSVFVFDISLSSSLSADLTVSNSSSDENGGNANLTNLTVVDVALSGANPAAFDLQNLTDGQVLGKGQSQGATVVAKAARNYRPHSAILNLATDVGAPLGGDGADYLYTLVAVPQTPGIWQALAGGAWESATNWSLGTSPTAGQTVRFSLESDYTVSLGSSRSHAGLIVTNDHVRLDLNSHSLAIAGDVVVGDLATSLGRLTIEDGSVSAASLRLGATAAATGRIDVNAGGVIQVGSAWIGGTNLAEGGAGTVVVSSGGSLSSSGAIKFWPTGSLELQQGHVTAAAGFELAGGRVNGNGTLTGAVLNSGALDPTGVISIAGAYEQSQSGVLTIDAGPEGHYALHVSDLAILAGELEIVFPDGYAPSYGDALEVMTFGSRSGPFQSITGAEFAEGRLMFPVYSAAALTLYAIIPGDANGDGLVTGADYTIWADNYDDGVGIGTKTWEQGDWTGDGYVTGADYTIWADHYGDEVHESTAVPEPTTAALAIVVLAALAIQRNRFLSAS